MNIGFKKFNKKQLPLNDEMLSLWNEEGFLVIEQFYDSSECDNLKNRSKELINDLHILVFDQFLILIIKNIQKIIIF